MLKLHRAEVIGSVVLVVAALVAVLLATSTRAEGSQSTCVAATSASLASVDECEVLLDLYSSVFGLAWSSQTGWRTAADPCDWFGVNCNAAGIESLVLPFNGLDGALPQSLGDLSNLRVLDLSGNNLSGLIPSSLGGLSNLAFLDLSSNELSGGIPSSLAALSNLKVLDLSQTYLTGEIPASLGALSNLESLTLGSRLSGEVPRSLGNLSNLISLTIDGDFRGAIPSSLGDLSNLASLDLSYNNFSGEIPSSLGDLSNLVDLNLGGNNFSGEIPSSLGDLSNLSVLRLQDNRLSGEIPSSLANLSNLATLELGGNGCFRADDATTVWLAGFGLATILCVRSAFSAVVPVRLFDTRTAAEPSGMVAGGTQLHVQVAGQAGVPSHATAVVLNVTATQATKQGFVTVFSGPRPVVSSLNLAAGGTAANMVIVPIAPLGTVSFYSSAGTHLLADVAGYFTAVSSEVSDGRLVPQSPTRLFDTRTPAAPAGQVAGGSTLSVQVAGKAGVPASGASAVVMNVTGTNAATPGFVTAFPSGSPRPLASILNLERTGHTVANLAIVPLGSDGKVNLYSSTGLHLLGDVLGYFTDSTAPASTEGLFVPVGPARVYDTRKAPAPNGFVDGGETISVLHLNTAGIPVSGVAAVSINVTATQAESPGFITAFPAGQQRPLASVLNLTEVGETRPNAVIVPVGNNRRVNFFSSGGAHLIGDANGYFTN